MDVRRQKRLFEAVTRGGFPIPVVIDGKSYEGTRTHLKGEDAATLYGFEDRYSCSVLLAPPDPLPGKGSRVELAGKAFVVIGIQLFAGDISCRLDLRENF
jgi:hypothetical protein